MFKTVENKRIRRKATHFVLRERPSVGQSSNRSSTFTLMVLPMIKPNKTCVPTKHMFQQTMCFNKTCVPSALATSGQSDNDDHRMRSIPFSSPVLGKTGGDNLMLPQTSTSMCQVPLSRAHKRDALFQYRKTLSRRSLLIM